MQHKDLLLARKQVDTFGTVETLRPATGSEGTQGKPPFGPFPFVVVDNDLFSGRLWPALWLQKTTLGVDRSILSLELGEVVGPLPLEGVADQTGLGHLLDELDLEVVEVDQHVLRNFVLELPELEGVVQDRGLESLAERGVLHALLQNLFDGPDGLDLDPLQSLLPVFEDLGLSLEVRVEEQDNVALGLLDDVHFLRVRLHVELVVLAAHDQRQVEVADLRQKPVFGVRHVQPSRPPLVGRLVERPADPAQKSRGALVEDLLQVHEQVLLGLLDPVYFPGLGLELVGVDGLQNLDDLVQHVLEPPSVEHPVFEFGNIVFLQGVEPPDLLFLFGQGRLPGSRQVEEALDELLVALESVHDPSLPVGGPVLDFVWS